MEVELAQSEEEKARGLMFRESLEENKGMLFIYNSPGIYLFWMKNTLIPLDIIWISEDGKIVHIERALPCTTNECISYIPKEKAKYVLEVNYNFTERNNILLGNKVTFRAG